MNVVFAFVLSKFGLLVNELVGVVRATLNTVAHKLAPQWDGNTPSVFFVGSVHVFSVFNRYRKGSFNLGIGAL